MKSKKRGTVIVSALFAVLCLAQTASAFYAPNLQRWVNRDPVAEVGFEAGRRNHQPAISISDRANLYAFVRNSPIAIHDAWGLTASESSKADDMPSNEMSASVTYPPPGCPKNHAPCGRLIGERKEEDKKKDTCVKTCSYKMSKENPYASRLLGKGSIFIGDGTFGSANTITDQGNYVQIDVTTSCDQECPRRMACGERNENGSSWSGSKRKSRQIPEVIFVDF